MKQLNTGLMRVLIRDRGAELLAAFKIIYDLKLVFVGGFEVTVSLVGVLALQNFPLTNSFRLSDGSFEDAKFLDNIHDRNFL